MWRCIKRRVRRRADCGDFEQMLHFKLRHSSSLIRRPSARWVQKLMIWNAIVCIVCTLTTSVLFEDAVMCSRPLAKHLGWRWQAVDLPGPAAGSGTCWIGCLLPRLGSEISRTNHYVDRPITNSSKRHQSPSKILRSKTSSFVHVTHSQLPRPQRCPRPVRTANSS